MTTKQGMLSDREYITLLKAKIDVLEKTIAQMEADSSHPIESRIGAKVLTPFSRYRRHDKVLP